MKKYLLILGTLFFSQFALADSDLGGGFRVVNLPVQTGTYVFMQNYQITGSTTAGQTVATYTVPVGVTFYLQYAEAEAYYLSFTTTVSSFGTAYLSTNGTHNYTTQLAGAGLGKTGMLSFNPPLVFATGTVISWLVTPAAGTGTVWYGNLGGYYR